MNAIPYTTIFKQATVIKTTIVPLEAIQSLMHQVQIHATVDFRQDTVTMSSAESYIEMSVLMARFNDFRVNNRTSLWQSKA
jgi:hypothetical protein